VVPSDPFDRLDEIARVVDPATWMLVGGLMVHCHAQRADIAHARPTDDADVVVEIRPGSYSAAAAAIEGLGYRRHEPIDERAPFHRFTRRGSEHVDLMAPEGADVRFAGRAVLGVPGSRSALKRTTEHVTPGHSAVRLPDLESALSLKGAAYGCPGPDRARHLQDGVTLFACAAGADLLVSTSMRANINRLIAGLDQVEAWSMSPPLTRRRAVRGIQAIRPDWHPAPFILPTRRRPS